MNADYYWTSTKESETGWSKWTPDLVKCYYDVYVRYRQGSNRAPDAPYTVYYSGGSETVDVDQSTNGGTWVKLGRYFFANGTSGYTKLGNGPATTSKVVIADAVKYTPATAETKIVDNADSGYSDAGGGWWTSSYSSDRYGADYRCNASGTGESTATFQAALLAPGDYKVYCYYPQGSNRANDTPYTINYTGGSDTVEVNQQINGGQWNLLGTYYFDAGNHTVVISDDAQADKNVMADAVKFEPN